MDERKEQKSFIDQVKGKKKIQKSSIGVYKYLVHHSFFEVITNAYPEFYTIVKNKKLEKEFDKSIFKFMQKSALSPYIWKMPNEYRKFLKKTNYFKNLPYLQDLLYFEYSELFIFMQKNRLKKHYKFRMGYKYKLSKYASLKKYNYDVVNKVFNKKNQCFILGYFDNETDDVVYRPIDKLLYHFLKFIDKKESLKVNLRLFFKQNNLSYKEYAEVFKNVLNELYSKKVIV